MNSEHEHEHDPPAEERPSRGEDPEEVDVEEAFAAIVAQFDDGAPEVGPWPAAEDLDATVTGKGPPGADPGGVTFTSGRTARTGAGDGEPGAGAHRAPRTGPSADDLDAGGTTGADDDATGAGNSFAGVGGGRSGTGGGPGRHPADADGDIRDPDIDDINDAQIDAEGFVPPDPPMPRSDLIIRLAWAGVIGGPLGLLIAALGWGSVSSLLVMVSAAAFVAGFVVLVARMPTERPDDPDDGAVV
jgi:hypothetical protein